MDQKILKQLETIPHQALANLVTKEDAKSFATKADLTSSVTKADLKQFATKDDLMKFATKDDLKNALHAQTEDLYDVMNDLFSEADKLK